MAQSGDQTAVVADVVAGYTAEVEAVEQTARQLLDQLEQTSDDLMAEALVVSQQGDREWARQLMVAANSLTAVGGLAWRIKTAGHGRSSR